MLSLLLVTATAREEVTVVEVEWLKWLSRSAKDPKVQSIPNGECFMVFDGSSVFLKTDKCEEGNVLVVSLKSGCLYPLNPTIRVVLVDVTAQVTKRHL